MSGCGHIECIGLTACVMPRTVTPGGITFTEPSRAAAPPVEPCDFSRGGLVCTLPKGHLTAHRDNRSGEWSPHPDPVAGLREAVRERHEQAWREADGKEPDASLDSHSWLIEGCEACVRLEAFVRAALLAEPVPPQHPDDGHPHSWGCRRCGVDPAEPVPLDVERRCDFFCSQCTEERIADAADRLAAARLTDPKGATDGGG